MKKKSVQSKNPCQSLPCRQAGVIQTIYDIIKAHEGELKVETVTANTVVQSEKDSTGSKFIIVFPS